MSLNIGTVLHETDAYQVRVEYGVNVDGDEKAPEIPVYAIINKNTGVREGEEFMLPRALFNVKQLQDGLDQFYQTEAQEDNVIQLGQDDVEIVH